MKNAKKYIALAVVLSAFLFLTDAGSATTIVVIRGRTEVVLAADSKATYEAGSAAENAGPVSKIYGIGNLFLAVSGLVQDPETNFSVPQIVSDATRGLATVAEKMQALENRLGAALQTEVPAIKERDPDLYQKLVSGQSGLISLVVVGAEKGVPFAKGVEFTLTSSPQGLRASAKENSCPGDCFLGVKTLWLGQSQAIAKYMESHRTPRKPYADFARFLVQLEIDSKAEGVEGPIDIVRVTAAGAEWIQRKPDCPQILP